MLKIYRSHPEAKYRIAYGESQGIDLAAIEDIKIPPMGRYIARTGIHVAIPKGMLGLLKERSSLAVKKGVLVMAGVIDNSYRGELKVVLFNTTGATVRINKGDFFAQLLVINVLEPQIGETVVEVDSVEALGETVRGSGGFGSSDR